MDALFGGMAKATQDMNDAMLRAAASTPHVVVVPGGVAAAPPPVSVGAFPPAPVVGAYPPAPVATTPAYPPAGAPPTMDPLYGYFSAVAGADQQIDQRELQQCLTSSGIAGSYQPFSLETCTLMINMLDRDYSGKMGFNEFKELWTVLNQWKGTFANYDRDRSGRIDGNELSQALGSFGYRLSHQCVSTLVRRYGINGQIQFDAFVGCAVRLRALTDFFRRKDTAQNGTAIMQYDEFITLTMAM